MKIIKIVKTILLHFTILIIVIAFSGWVYQFMVHRGNDFEFIGGIFYFMYAFYLVLKIKNHRTKIILLGILYSLLALCTGMIFTELNEFALLFTTIINLIVQAFLLIKHPKSKNTQIWKSYLISLIITIVLSFFFTFLWLLSLAASGMPSNHY
ncbi:hypothetical protein AR687_19765 [Flavobacteriaceae bacterium CRH]|nr:hypothetical protein AR687_19765 [Flavobacteriaceae bacterium CRH]